MAKKLKKAKKTKLSKKTKGNKKPVKKISKKASNKKKSAQKKSGKKTITQKSEKKEKKKKDKTYSIKGKKHKAPFKKAKAKKRSSSQKTKKIPSDETQNQIKKTKKLKALLSYREKELEKLLIKEKEEKLILKDMEGRKYCIVENCDYPAIVDDHCRLHFFGLFKKIKKKKIILKQELIMKSLQALIIKYSESVFDYLFKDLSSEKHFKSAMKKISGEETQNPDTEEDFA